MSFIYFWTLVEGGYITCQIMLHEKGHWIKQGNVEEKPFNNQWKLCLPGINLSLFSVGWVETKKFLNICAFFILVKPCWNLYRFGGRFLRWEIIKRSLIIWIASAVPGSQPRCQTKKLTLLPQSKYHLEVMITAVLPFQNYHLWTMWWTFNAVSDDGSWIIFSSIPRHGSQVIAVRFVGLLRHQSD